MDYAKELRAEKHKVRNDPDLGEDEKKEEKEQLDKRISKAERHIFADGGEALRQSKDPRAAEGEDQ